MKGILSMGIGAVLTIVAVLMMVNVIPSPLATVAYEADLTGRWFINDELATTTSHHTVDDPKLNFKFIADSYGSYVTEVKVELWNEAGTGAVDWRDQSSGGMAYILLDETVADKEWTGWGILPSPGIYTIKGKVQIPGETFRLMSVKGEWTGSDGTFTGQTTFESMQPSVSSVVCFIAGIALIVVGVYWERET